MEKKLKWRFSNFYLCRSCGYLDEILSPEDDNCPLCKKGHIIRLVYEGEFGKEKIVKFNPKKHN